MLICELHEAITFQQDAEQIISRDPALQHYAIDQEHRYFDFALAHTRKEHILQ